MKTVKIKSIKKIENTSMRYDIEVNNVNNFFANNILVHNSFCGITFVPEKDGTDDMIDGRILVYSKGLGSKGLCFKNNEKNKDNIYIRTLRSMGIIDIVLNTFKNVELEEPIHILGEIYGPGVQDLTYGEKISFRIFDIARGYRQNIKFTDFETLTEMKDKLKLEMVPILFVGPYSKDTVMKYTVGKETVSGKAKHIREGVVVKPKNERNHPQLGRVILKSVSEDYLTRKGGTEFN
jgi:RNA ligase (TIGR02306 family)